MTTSLTWTFNSRLVLVSCGIDSEHVERFCKWEKAGKNFLPFVYTKKERAHCMRLADPATGLCAAFCMKEAMYKALKRPYDFTDCEFLYAGTPQNSLFALSGKIAPRMRNIQVCAKLLMPVRGQVTAIVYLLKNPAASCEESSIPMERKHICSRSLTPKQASRNALAVGFSAL